MADEYVSPDYLTRPLPVPLPDSSGDLFSVNQVTAEAQFTAVPPDLPYGDLVKDYDSLLAYQKGGGSDAKLLFRAFAIPETRYGAREAYLANPELEKALRYYTVPDNSFLKKFVNTTYDIMPYISGAVITGGLVYGIPAGGGITAFGGAEAAGVTAGETALAPVTAESGVSLVGGPYLLEGPTSFPILEGGAAVAVEESSGFGVYGTLAKIGSGAYSIGKDLFKSGVDTATEIFKVELGKEIGGEVGSLFGATGDSGLTGAGVYPDIAGGKMSFLDMLKTKSGIAAILILILGGLYLATKGGKA